MLGLADNTLVIVTSDNGPEVGTVINMREKYEHDGARPWRGMKRDNWEGGHRVPMIVRWPGKVQAGASRDQTVCLTDIMATCAAIGRCRTAQRCRRGQCEHPAGSARSRRTMRCATYTLHQTISLALAIRKGNWKYLDHQGSGGNNYNSDRLKQLSTLGNPVPSAPGQLYNLAADPGETDNLYFEYPQVVKELKGKLEEFKESGRSVPRRR